MNHKQLMQQMADLKAELDSYRVEMATMRKKVEAYEDVETPVVAVSNAPTSRRRMLKRLALGAGAFAAVTAAGAMSTGQQVLAATASDNAIDATGGPDGYGITTTGGLAPLRMAPAAPASGQGAPATGSHQAGELYVDSNGSLFFCVKDGTGTAAVWRKLAGQDSSGTLHLLPVATRFVDTRTGTNNLNDTQGKYGNTTTRTYNFKTLVGKGGVTLPSGITGITGNITIVGPNAGGFAQLYASTPGTSTINWNASTDTANGFTASLAADGTLKVTTYFYANTGNSDLILDITGYYM